MLPSAAGRAGNVFLLLACAAAEPLRVVVMQPITGGWPAGAAMQGSMNLMAEQVNANPALLPGHELELIAVDTQCDPAVSERVMLDLLFEGEVQSLDFTDVHTSTEQSQLIGAMSDPGYVAIIGCGCSGATTKIANLAAKARKPLISHSASSPALSDRSQFPYFWRTALNDQPALEAMGQVVAALGMTEAAVWGSPLTQGWAEYAVNGLEAASVTPVGRPVPELPGGRGYYLYAAGGPDVVLEAAQLAELFVRSPTRGNLFILYDDDMAHMLCALHRAGVQGLISLGLDWTMGGLISDRLDESACTSQEIVGMLNGGLGVGPVTARTDRGSVHGCTPGDPVDVHATILAALSVENAEGNLPYALDYLGPPADAVCMLALALHAMLSSGVTPAELHGMTPETFQAMQEALAATDFEGVIGNVQFKDQGDPLGLPGPDPSSQISIAQMRPHQSSLAKEVAGLIAGGNLEWTTELRFQGLGAEIEVFSGAVATFTECGYGFALDFAANACAACPPGSQPGGTGCEACPAGSFSGSDGPDGSMCTVCPPGTISDAGQPACTPCPAGTFVKGGECVLCAPGTFAAENQTAQCAQCPIGQFAADEGAVACTECPSTFLTLAVGSTAAARCTCPEGRFWNRKDDRCDACPGESFCPGGLLLPVVFQGFYGKYVGSVAGDVELQAAKFSGTYEKDEGRFYKLEVYRCASVDLCPGKTMTFDLSKWGAPIESRELVRVGDPLEGSCPDLREGIACARCSDDYYGAAECVACSDGTMGGNIVLLLVFPLIMLGVYRATASTGTARVQTAFILVSSFGMAAFFMQTIAVLDTITPAWPAAIAWLFELSQLLMFDLQGLSMSCMIGHSFAAQYSASIVVPLFIILTTGVSYVLTNVLPVAEGWKMRPTLTFSMLGMIMSGLYISLVKIVLAFFECPENPAAEPTVAKAKGVVCGSDEHNAGLPAMVLGLCLYVIGGYLCAVHAMYNAPKNWANVSFRERWKFMLVRWRPDVYFWGCVMMTRNLLVAFGGIISTEPRVQLLYVVAIVTVAATLTAVHQPWRVTGLNHYDVTTGLILSCIGVIGVLFVSLGEEIYQGERFGQPVQDKQDLLDAFTTVLLLLVFGFVVLFIGLVVWCLKSMLPGGTEKTLAYDDNVCKALTKQLEEQVKRPDFVGSAGQLISECTAYDRGGLRNFLNKLSADPTKHTSGATDTISIGKAKVAERTVVEVVSA